MFNLSFSQPIIPQLLKNRVRFVKETPGYKGIAAAVLRTSAAAARNAAETELREIATRFLLGGVA